jgi:hypothetical protein
MKHAFLTLVTVTTFAFVPYFAYAAEEPVPCPSANLLKKMVNSGVANVDTVQYLKEENGQKLFSVYSSADSIFDENSKRWWSINADVTSVDFNTAFSTALNDMNKISVSTEPYAKNIENVYFCLYAPDVYAISVQANSTHATLSKFNLTH